MAFQIRRVTYFYATVEDRPGEGYQLLSRLADLGVNMLAFTGVPVGPTRIQFTIFPEDRAKLQTAAAEARISMDGPHPAFLVQGDDELGALAGIHEQLYRAQVSVYASNGVTDGRGTFGYVLYVRPEEFDAAARALGV